LGYEKLSESKITVGVKYTTRIYRRSPEDLPGAPSLVISPNLPNNQTAGVAVPIEGDRWMVTLVGWTEPPPRDDAGFLAFAQALPAPDIGNLIRQAEPLSDAVGYEYRCGLRHHYEKLSRFPTGYLVMGDAFCSFDPIYGQGMTSALMQAALLDRLLEQSVNAPQLARQFFKQAAKIIDIPWQMTVNEDFRLPTTQGKKPLGTDLINAYTRLVQQATHTDPVVYTAFLRAMNLVAPPSSLFHLHILWRVFQANRRPAAPLHYSRDRRIVLDKTPG
jgi:flavin-dependent dehydrogenase